MRNAKDATANIGSMLSALAIITSLVTSHRTPMIIDVIAIHYQSHTMARFSTYPGRAWVMCVNDWMANF